MSTIGNAVERLEAALGRSSGFGVGTNTAVTTSNGGLECSTSEGRWVTHSDLPRSLGGTGSAGSPSVLVRAALGSCMAMSYRLRAARHGIELTSIRVTVETDATLAGMLSTDTSTPPGFTEVRYHVEIESPASPDDVGWIVDEGDRLSPMLDVFTRRNVLRRTTTIRTSGA